MTQLTKNFSEDEVKCKCGKCEGLPSGEKLAIFMAELRWLQQVREEYGKPMHLSSGYRCPAHNSKVSSTGITGPHTTGAFDVKVSGAEAVKFLEAAIKCGVKGLGFSQKGPHSSRFIHVDRIGQRMWTY